MMKHAYKDHGHTRRKRPGRRQTRHYNFYRSHLSQQKSISQEAYTSTIHPSSVLYCIVFIDNSRIHCW